MRLCFIALGVLCKAVYKDDCRAVPVEGLDDGPEGLLTGGIPDLQLNFVVVDFDGFGLELSSQGDMVFLDEEAFDVASQEATFANS